VTLPRLTLPLLSFRLHHPISFTMHACRSKFLPHCISHPAASSLIVCPRMPLSLHNTVPLL
jgi:hypothetical protein